VSADSEGDESPAVAAFLRERRAGVVARAIETLETCPTDDLAAQAHRLAGTLGVYGLDDAAAACRQLMQVVGAGTETDVATARETTLNVLRANASDQGREEPA
jgi:HPt (histidine-containing phosphotransfer) domain-containing protein